MPWARDAQVIYEHYHRYLWARPLVAGRRVLDLGSGEGYGAALLAQTASAVTGVDIDERDGRARARELSRRRLSGGLRRPTSSAFADDAFEAVVAFEMIEHVAEHERVLAEIARVLAPGGLLVMSTPERRAYSDDRDFHQPVPRARAHAGRVHRAARQPFHRRLAVRPARDRRLAHRRARRRPDGSTPRSPIERAGDDWREAGVPEPLYLVAVASTAICRRSRASRRSSTTGSRCSPRSSDAEFRAKLEREARAADRHAARAARGGRGPARRRSRSSWQALERLRGVIGEHSFLGRHLQALLHRVFKASR